VPSSCRIRPVAQTGHGSSVRHAVIAVMPPPPSRPDPGCTGRPGHGYRHW
jgi:hypothetical protein